MLDGIAHALNRYESLKERFIISSMFCELVNKRSISFDFAMDGFAQKIKLKLRLKSRYLAIVRPRRRALKRKKYVVVKKRDPDQHFKISFC